MSPNLNAYAERFVLSIKSECLERIVPLGEGHLRQAISEYMAHYHRERNHQGLGNALIDGERQDVEGSVASFVATGSADCSVSITGRPPPGSGSDNGTGRPSRSTTRPSRHPPSATLPCGKHTPVTVSGVDSRSAQAAMPARGTTLPPQDRPSPKVDRTYSGRPS